MNYQPFYTDEQREEDKVAMREKFEDEIDLNIIEEASARYQIFKDYVAQFYTYDFLGSYANRVIRDDDVNAIVAAIHEINEVRKHPLLKDPKTRSQLYMKGQQLMTSIANSKRELRQYDKQTMTLILYILHKNLYFNTFPLPARFFEIASGTQDDDIGIVYAKYFLFYKYLSGRLKDLAPSALKEDPENNTAQKSGPFDTFKELFYKGRVEDGTYQKVIDLISADLPQNVRDQCEITKEDEYRFASVDGDNMFWNKEISYLAGLYNVCAQKGWIRDQKKQYLKTARKSFNLKNGRTAFQQITGKEECLDMTYKAPFRMLFENITPTKPNTK